MSMVLMPLRQPCVKLPMHTSAFLSVPVGDPVISARIVKSPCAIVYGPPDAFRLLAPGAKSQSCAVPAYSATVPPEAAAPVGFVQPAPVPVPHVIGQGDPGPLYCASCGRVIVFNSAPVRWSMNVSRVVKLLVGYL